MKSLKKSLSLLLALVMAISCMSVGAFADDDIIDTAEELIAAVAAGGTVTLGGDVTLSSAQYISTSTVLDLNGHVLTVNTNSTVGAFYLNNSASSLTIKDSGENGQIITNGTKYGIYVSSSGSSATIEGGKLTVNNTNDGASAVRVNSGTTFTMTGGEIEVPIVKTSSYWYQNFNAYGLDNSGTAEISGGKITVASNGTNYAVSSSGTLTVSGGRIEASNANNTAKAPYTIYVTGGSASVTGGNFVIGDLDTYGWSEAHLVTGSTTVSGGTFTGLELDIEGVRGKLESGYTLRANTDGSYTVVKCVAQIGDTGYESLAAAIAAANVAESAVTIKLLANCETGDTYTITNPLKLTKQGAILDLNGKTLTVTKNFSLVIQADNAIVKNGTIQAGANNGKATGINSYGLIVNGCDGVTIEDVTSNGGISIGGSTGETPNAAAATDVTMSNCTVTSGDYYAVCAQQNSTLTIESGSYTADTQSTYSGAIQATFEGNDGPKGTITVTGGTFTGNINNNNVGNIVVMGGTFSSNPTAYVAEGYEAVDNGNDTWTVKAAKTYVAEIGTTKYETLEAAFAAAQDGQTITLLSDVTLTDRLFINAGATPAYAGNNNRYATTSENKSITLDLNGKNITSSSNIALAGGSLTVTGAGTISTTSSGLAPIEVRGTGNLEAKRTLTIGQDVKLVGSGYGLNIFGSNDAQKNLIDVTINGDVTGTVFVLGNLTNSGNEINIIVNGKVAAVTDNTAEDPSVGIALNGNANVTVNEGATVSGDSGIEVRAGSLIVNDGTIKATAQTYSYKENGSGSTTKGAAIAVAQHNTKLPTRATINGGTLTGGAYKIGVTDVNNDMSTVTVTAKDAYTNSTAVPAGYVWKDLGNNTRTLSMPTYVAQIGDNKYESLADAIAAVPTNGTETTITMIADETLADGIVVAANQNIVLELNGKKITEALSKSGTSALITNNGTLTIQDNTDTNKDGTGDGKISYQNANPDSSSIPGYASNTIINHGTLTIESGFVENTTTGGYAAYTVDNLTNGNLYTPTFTMNGGELYNSYTDAVRMFLNSDSNLNKVVINGGILASDKASGRVVVVHNPNGKANKGELDITGGTILGKINTWSAANAGGVEDRYADNQYGPVSIKISGGKIRELSFNEMANETLRKQSLVVTGGLYTVKPDAAYIADGYEAVDNNDPATSAAYPWTVAEAKFVGYTDEELLNDQLKNAEENVVTPITPMPGQSADNTAYAAERSSSNSVTTYEVTVANETPAVQNAIVATANVSDINTSSVIGKAKGASATSSGANNTIELFVKAAPTGDSEAKSVSYAVDPYAIVNGNTASPVELSNADLNTSAAGYKGFTFPVAAPAGVANGSYVKATHTWTVDGKHDTAGSEDLGTYQVVNGQVNVTMRTFSTLTLTATTAPGSQTAVPYITGYQVTAGDMLSVTFKVFVPNTVTDPIFKVARTTTIGEDTYYLDLEEKNAANWNAETMASVYQVIQKGSSENGTEYWVKVKVFAMYLDAQLSLSVYDGDNPLQITGKAYDAYDLTNSTVSGKVVGNNDTAESVSITLLDLASVMANANTNWRQLLSGLTTYGESAAYFRSTTTAGTLISN